MTDDMYVLTMEVSVHDRDNLFEAAMKHAVEYDGLDPSEAKALLMPDGEISPGDCLLMLIDPGQLIGCDIIETRCEAQEGMV